MRKTCLVQCACTHTPTVHTHTKKLKGRELRENDPPMREYWVGLQWIATIVLRVYHQYVHPANSGHSCYPTSLFAVGPLQSHTNVLHNIEKGAQFTTTGLMYVAKLTISFQDMSTFHFYRMTGMQKTPKTSQCQEDIAILSFLSRLHFQEARKG